MDIYALTIAFTETHPEQINNEVRNALTHLTRGLTASSTKESAAEIRRARSHFERAKRDSLKLAIIAKRDQIRSAVLRIEIKEGTVPNPIRRRLKEIEHTRRRLYKEEVKGALVAKDLEGLLADVLDLEDAIYDSFEVPGPMITAWRRIFIIAKRTMFVATTAVTFSVVAGLLTLSSLPSDSPLGRVWSSIKDLYAQSVSPGESAAETNGNAGNADATPVVKAGTSGPLP